MSDRANDRQEGGNHYRNAEGEQHWDRLVRLFGIDIAYVYFVGNATAYLERYRTKHKDHDERMKDLRKARHYVDKLIELEEVAYKQKVLANLDKTETLGPWEMTVDLKGPYDTADVYKNNSNPAEVTISINDESDIEEMYRDPAQPSQVSTEPDLSKLDQRDGSEYLHLQDPEAPVIEDKVAEISLCGSEDFSAHDLKLVTSIDMVDCPKCRWMYHLKNLGQAARRDVVIMPDGRVIEKNLNKNVVPEVK